MDKYEISHIDRFSIIFKVEGEYDSSGDAPVTTISRLSG